MTQQVRVLHDLTRESMNYLYSMYTLITPGSAEANVLLKFVK